MKPIWVSFLTGFAILFSFQNCQKNPLLDELTFYSKNPMAVNVNKINLSEKIINEFQFINRENEDIIKNGQTFTLVTNNVYHVDLVTGRILSESEFSQVKKNYCLTEALRSELNSILKSSSVCQTGNKQRVADQVCLQVIKTPYAIIITDKDQFELGSASDGCESNLVDLCDEGPELLKGFIAHLKLQLNSLGCN